MEKECLICKKEFYISPCLIGKKKFCSRICYMTQHQKNTRILNCLQCLKKIKVNGYKIKNGRGKYCNRLCKDIDLKRIKLGNKLSLETKKKIGDSHRGSKAYNWKGGVTQLSDKIRKSPKYIEWRKSIFKRDNWICQSCKQQGNTLHPDHIEPFSLILSKNNIRTLEEASLCQELWNLKNGRTLCVPCHRETSTYGRNLPVGTGAVST